MLLDMARGTNGLDSDELAEKDETENQLEKLVFGDHSGFHEGLDSYKKKRIDFLGVTDGEQQATQDGSENENLEDLDDTDVREAELPVVHN